MRQRRGGRSELIRTIAGPLLLGFLTCLPGFVVQAATLNGRVVGVTDGDTLVVLDAHKVTHRVRLAGIDAPEKHQAFAERAHQRLATRVHRQQVRVEHSHSDRYGRLVGQVWIGGQDVNLLMVQQGWAWHYKAYAQEQSPSDRLQYAEAEKLARQGRLGLWADANPTPPWTFRTAQRQAPPTAAPSR